MREVRQEFKLTQREKDRLRTVAQEDGYQNVSAWIRLQCGLYEEPNGVEGGG